MTDMPGELGGWYGRQWRTSGQRGFTRHAVV